MKENELLTQLEQIDNFQTIDENLEFLRKVLGESIGLVDGKYDILNGQAQVGIAYLESMANKELIGLCIIDPILETNIDFKSGVNDILSLLELKIIRVVNIKRITKMKQVCESLLEGYTVLFINNSNTALLIKTKKLEKRAIEKPINEVTALASMDSFTEDLDTNCSMILRRLPTPKLRVEEISVGRLSRTKLLLLWIEGIADNKAIDDVRQRLRNIDIDYVDGIGALAELIEDSPLTLFPKYRQTQRPDMVTKGITDGHFALLCNNSPYAFLAPETFWDNFKTMDDYSDRSLVSSFLRMVRFLSFLLATMMSPLYLSFVTYNHSIVPPPLALNIAIGRDGVPFPSFFELIIMTFAISIIREASLRIPGSVGYFVGALAAVIIGQSAVTAGYVSASLIIVVAISAISSFAICTTTMVYPARLINYFLILFSGMFGMFGLINGFIILVWHTVSLESFGIPYMYPLVPFDMEAMKDMIIRVPVSKLKKRPWLLAPFNRSRMSDKGLAGKNKK